MINLILAIISSSLVSITMRVGEGRAKNNISMLSVNYFICMILSVIYTGIGNLFQTGEGLGTALVLGCINGFFYILSLVLFQNSVKQNGVVLSSIFMKLGIMMPLIISIILFKEIPTMIQGIGFVIAIISIVLINLKVNPIDNIKENSSLKKDNGIKNRENALGEKVKTDLKKTEQKSENKKTAGIGLIFVLFGCGTADGMSKIYQEVGTERFEELFLVLTFVVAFILSIVLVIVKKQKFAKSEFIYGAMLGIPNYFSARFLLKALGELSAVVVYPTFSIGTIAVITMTGLIFFKEKITKLQMFAIGLIAVAVVMLN